MTDERRPAAVFLAVLLGAALTGCASLAPREASSGATVAGVSVREHRSGRFVELIGAKAQHAPPYLGTPGTNFYCLRSIVDRQSGEIAEQLYVADSYDGAERNWDAAHDAAGRALPVIPISRMEIACESGSCSYAEEFAADLPADELRANPTGFAATFTDRAGDRLTIRPSAEQIATQLAALALQQKSMRGAAAATEPSPALSHQP